MSFSVAPGLSMLKLPGKLEKKSGDGFLRSTTGALIAVARKPITSA